MQPRQILDTRSPVLPSRTYFISAPYALRIRNHAPARTVEDLPVRRRVDMREAVIVEAVRSPIGKRNGGLAGVHPVDLSADVLTELLARTKVEPDVVEDVVWGCVSQIGDQSSNIAR